VTLDRRRLQSQDLDVVDAHLLTHGRPHALIIPRESGPVTPFFVVIVGYA
jgi:hypothetical protein